jgi:hypothetical protein
MFNLRADPGYYVPTTGSFHCRDSHCLEFATAADCEGLRWVRVGPKVTLLERRVSGGLIKRWLVAGGGGR